MLKTLRKRRSQDKELQRPHSYPDTEIAKVPEDAVENPKSSTKDVYMKSDSLKSSESKQEKTSTKSVENSSKKDRPDSLKSNEKKKGKTSTKTVENTSEKNRPSSKSGSRKTRCEETLDKLSHLVATDSTDGTLVSRNKDDLPEIINEVYTMAKVEKNHKKMKTESVFDTLKQVPGSTEDEVVKTKAVMALGYLIWDRADTSIVYEAAKKTHAITQLLNQLVPLIASNDDVSSGCSQSDLLQSLKHYAVDEKNKKIICEEGGKDIIPTFLKSDKPAVQSLAAELICSLSFIESNRCLLLKEKSLLKDLTKLTHSPDNHVSRNSANALLVLQDYMHDDVFVSQGETSTDGHQHVDIDQEIDSEDDDDVIIRPGSAKRTGTTEVDLQLKSVAPVPPPPPPPPAAAPPPPPPAAPAVFSHGPLPPPPPTQRKEGHIMLSYNWDNQKLVLKINEKLKEHGYKTWIDVEHMSDSILDAMAHAVQDADIVLLCFCQSYQNSTNCRTEGEYVFSRKKPLIPLRMKSYSPQNWLGALIGNQLYVDFSDGEVVFNDKMKDLLEQIKRRQSKLADQTVNYGYHAVYMLKYISGMSYSEILQPSATMSYNAGSLLGRIDNALRDFHYNGFEYENAVLKSDDVTSVQKSLYVIENDKRRQLIEEVISAFKEQVIPNIGNLRKGIIHGDYNPNNVIVSKNRLPPRTDSDKNVNHDINGIVDFSDTQYSYYVNEIAIAISHFMMYCNHGDPLAIGKTVLAGYESNFRLNDIERKVLQVFVATRMANIAVRGTEHLNTQTTDNEYMRNAIQLCWECLETYGYQLLNTHISMFEE
ncbi:uncharacterized protein LOC102806257 [Saccoglossus kowalevskii]|uniref:Uncharacterized protein LOC102806257 n=1 Tax=Saccoglossus kowalevskii TaxID=10224 RepID=A0ABM0LV77_SACKO|nr:PREDICTED: uncharacterized protein LOC102806257 [Saccoglossus kowalevskii]